MSMVFAFIKKNDEEYINDKQIQRHKNDKCMTSEEKIMPKK